LATSWEKHIEVEVEVFGEELLEGIIAIGRRYCRKQKGKKKKGNLRDLLYTFIKQVLYYS
jgi:hypothetical protein